MRRTVHDTADGGVSAVSDLLREALGDGPRSARIVVIGEALGAMEQARKRPFVGASGMLLDTWMAAVGVARRDVRVDNVCQRRPPHNKIEAIPKHELADWTVDLHRRLAELDDPIVVVPTGMVALRALTGKSGITKHRGSIYEYVDGRGRVIKVIPTLHPAYVLRTPSFERRCRADWARIAADAAFRDLRLPAREHRIRPTLAEVEEYVYTAATADALAIDIETPREVQWTAGKPTKSGKPGKPKRILGAARITCVGLATTPDESLTVPTTLAYWRDPETLARVWELLKTIAALPVAKVTHNGLFDTFWLAQDHDVALARWRWDTLAMSHCLNAVGPHSLAYCASVDTREPYWKDQDGKDDEDDKFFEPSAEGLNQFWIYCGRDAAVTRELADTYRGRLETAGRMPLYDAYYRTMFGPLLRMMRHGVRLNAGACHRRSAHFLANVIGAQDKLTAMAGEPLYGPKGALSAKRVARYFYETLKLPPVYQRGTAGTTRRVTADEVTIRKLMKRHKTAVEPGGLILQSRRWQKLREFVDTKAADPDGRVRCSYKFTTRTGRLSSSKNPRRTGRNLQNLDHEVRDVYLPDEGCIFVEADLSQAESRIVYVLTGDPALIKIARTPPWEYDVHRENAALIFGVPPDAVTKDQRYLGKRGIHSAHYGVQGTTTSEVLLKDGYTYTPNECQEIIDTYMRRRPAIPAWQRAVRQLIMRERKLVTAWGWVFDATHERLDDDLYRDAYATEPQSDVGLMTNQWGLKPLDAYIRARRLRSRINLNIHDAVTVSCPPDEAYEVAAFLRDSLERPKVYRSPVTGSDVELTIPVEFKLGVTLRPSVEYKRLPPEAEFHEAVAGLASARR